MMRYPDDPRERRAYVLRLYAAVFGGENGDAILDDIDDAFHHRRSAALEAEIAEIPHPFRAYYEAGQRSVALHIRETVEIAKRGDYATD